MAELDADLGHIIPSSVLAPFWAKLVVGFVSLVCFARSYDGDFVFDDSQVWGHVWGQVRSTDGGTHGSGHRQHGMCATGHVSCVTLTVT